MRMYFILMPIAVLIWFVGIEIGIKMIELAPMGIHDYYFYYPKIEELEGFSVSPWKTDPAVVEGKMVYRDCVYDYTFYHFTFRQEKWDKKDGSYDVSPFDVKEEAKVGPIVWATVLGSALYFSVYSIIFWGIWAICKKFSRHKKATE